MYHAYKTMGIGTVGVLTSLFALCLSKPCLELEQDKNDGLKIFTPLKGIASYGFLSLNKRDASNRIKRSVNGIFMTINDNVLYADDNDLISNVKNKVFLPLYVFRSKSFVTKARNKREAIKDCPWEEGVSSPTSADFYAKKPSDIKTVNVPAEGKSENKKLKGSEDENMKRAESTLIFTPLFAYRQRRRRYRIRP